MFASGSVSSKGTGSFTFHGYPSVLLSMCILLAGVLWVVYGYLPHQYYLPVSFGGIAAFGVAAFLILTKKMNL
jgi:hypothetical protein